MRPDYSAGSAYHQKRAKYPPHTVRCFDAAFAVLGPPRSVVDFGCGEGGPVVQRARQLGLEAVGVDLAVEEDTSFVHADLRDLIDLRRRFHWVLCWEVAEHLPLEYAPRIVETCVQHMEPGGRILFTAARRGQRGPGHVNCQDPAWWAQFFFTYGLELAVEPTFALRQAWAVAAPRCPWYGRNVQVFWRTA